MTSDRPRLLLVDDNENFRQLVMTWLEPSYDIVSADGAKTAMESLDGRKPDLIVLDVMMPDISGLELFGTIRRKPELEDVPVLFLTAYHQVLDGEDKDFFNRCRVLLKPFEIKELTEQIEQMLHDAEASPG